MKKVIVVGDLQGKEHEDLEANFQGEINKEDHRILILNKELADAIRDEEKKNKELADAIMGRDEEIVELKKESWKWKQMSWIAICFTVIISVLFFINYYLW